MLEQDLDDNAFGENERQLIFEGNPFSLRDESFEPTLYSGQFGAISSKAKLNSRSTFANSEMLGLNHNKRDS